MAQGVGNYLPYCDTVLFVIGKIAKSQHYAMTADSPPDFLAMIGTLALVMTFGCSRYSFAHVGIDIAYGIAGIGQRADTLLVRIVKHLV